MRERGGPDARHVPGRQEQRRLRRRVLGGAVRVLLVTGTLVAVYVTAPLTAPWTAAAAVRMTACLLVLSVVLGLQLRAVTRSPYPTVRGIEAVVVSVPLVVLLFATAYVRSSYGDADAFTEPVSRLDGVYFSMTVLTTVGFGDIAPVADVARAMVTAQLVVDLVLGGFLAKVLVGAVQRRRDALQEGRDG